MTATDLSNVAVAARTSSQRQQAIDRSPPDLETLRDLGGAQTLGLEGGDLGSGDRGWAALVDAPQPRGADPFMAEPMRGCLGHWFTPRRSRYGSLRCPSQRRRACPRGPIFCSLRPLTTSDLETRSNAAFSGTVVRRTLSRSQWQGMTFGQDSDGNRWTVSRRRDI